jgi:hypothetical protein
VERWTGDAFATDSTPSAADGTSARAQTSQRAKGLGVMLYLLGLSYGVVSLALEALGVYMRLLFLGRWTLWRGLTHYRTWRGP